MEAPERIVAWATGIQPENGGAGLWVSDPEVNYTGIEYIRADLLDAHIGAVLERAANAGYVACAETRHVTLGQKVEASILALIEKEGKP